MDDEKVNDEHADAQPAVVLPQQKQMDEYAELIEKFIAEAEELFGEKTDYIFEGVAYHNGRPEVILSDSYFQTREKAYIVKLNGKAINDRKDGIFQLSHEAVHLWSPVQQDEEEGNEVNYLEEGMATWFSKRITERETNDLEYCGQEIEKNEKYKKAYELYLALIAIDKEAVKKLRGVTPFIARIKAEDFETAGIKADKKLIDVLLEKF